MRPRLLCLLLALVGCADDAVAPVPPPTPQAALVDAVLELNQAAAAAHAGGYKIVLTITTTDSTPPRVGVLILPR